MNTITVTLKDKSLLDVRAEFPDLFYNQNWYDNEPFAREKVSGTWKVNLEPIKDSFNKAWDEQQKLLKKGEETPPAAVLTYAICKHFKETGKRVFETNYVRTSSVYAVGNHVDLGDFDAEGLYVGSYWDDYCLSDLGLSASRKESGTLESLDTSESLSLESRVAKLEEIVENVRNLLVL